MEYYYEPPNIHYEQIIELGGDYENDIHNLKQQAFLMMDELDGWCPKNKASILIDFILLLKAKTVVEIGVFGGKSVIPMAYILKNQGQGKVYGIDPWQNSESIIGMEGANKEWWQSIDHEAVLTKLKEKIKNFQLENQIELIRSTSEHAAPIYHIDLLHIDGNHGEVTSYIDVTKWVPLVRSGGLIIFDDINWATTGKAVRWLNKHCVRLAEFKGVENLWGVWVKP